MSSDAELLVDLTSFLEDLEGCVNTGFGKDIRDAVKVNELRQRRNELRRRLRQREEDKLRLFPKDES